MTAVGVGIGLEELLALRARAAAVEAAVARRSADRHAGVRHSPFRGRGIDYAESRLYAAGDDARHIDWRVTARTGRVHSKLFQAERERITALVLDTRPEMAFGTRACFKRVQAARLAGLLAWLAAGEGDRLCAAACGPHPGLVPPAGSRRGLLAVLRALSEWGSGTGEERTSEPLDAVLDRLARVLRPGSHVLIALDHRSIDHATLQAAQRLRRHHDLVVALVVDPLELEAPPPARYPVANAGRFAWLALDGPDSRAAWNRHFHAALTTAHGELQRIGIRSRTVRTDADPVVALRLLLRGAVQREAA